MRNYVTAWCLCLFSICLYFWLNQMYVIFICMNFGSAVLSMPSQIQCYCNGSLCLRLPHVFPCRSTPIPASCVWREARSRWFCRGINPAYWSTETHLAFFLTSCSTESPTRTIKATASEFCGFFPQWFSKTDVDVARLLAWGTKIVYKQKS